MLKEENCKMHNYPMGLVKDIVRNTNEEVTGAWILKGKSGETVKRHVSSLIPILRSDHHNGDQSLQIDSLADDSFDDENDTKGRVKFKRKAAIASRQKTKDLLSEL